MNIDVHDTAFIVAYYRSLYEDISKDPYAKLWVRPGSIEWALDFAQKVCPHDRLLHSMRNRYFHDRLQEIANSNDKTVFINMGAGFSMYPYVLPESVVTLELDFPEVVDYKSHHVTQFIEQGKLPNRDVTHINVDLTNKENQEEVSQLLKKYSDYRSVILIEGVFFFLSEPEIQDVLDFCRRIQKQGDVLLCVSYEETIEGTPVFERLKRYFSEVLDSHNNPFTVLPRSLYQGLNGYSLSEVSNGLQMARELGHFPEIEQYTDVLNEYFYFLLKN